MVARCPPHDKGLIRYEAVGEDGGASGGGDVAIIYRVGDMFHCDATVFVW